MERDPLVELIIKTLPGDMDDRETVASEALQAVNELVDTAVEMIEGEPGLLDLYMLLAEKKHYPLLLRGGLPVRDPTRLTELAAKLLMPLVRHGHYDEAAALTDAAGKEPFLLYDATRLYVLGRLEELRSIAQRHGLEPWVLEYTALLLVAVLARGLRSLLEARSIDLKPFDNKCPVCGSELVDKVCPICGGEYA
jgi:hypothetical protein